MKTRRCISVVAVSLAFLAVALPSHREEGVRAQQPNQAFTWKPGGFIPPPMDLSHLRRTRAQLVPPALLQPPYWDWRAMGGVTPVRDQNPYGTCWAFASIGDLESKVMIDFAQTMDYSEHNVVACAPNLFYELYGYDCNTGGNNFIATNYLSRLGSVDETCDQYPGACNYITCYNFNCNFRRQVTEWRVIVGDIVQPSDVPLIKDALMTYGPVCAGMFSGWYDFQTYDSSDCLWYAGTEGPDHAVLIVGWNDFLCGGYGAWIVKNSWGTGWGDGGYFYIAYGSAQIGSYANVITDYKNYEWNEKIYYYDDFGYTIDYGWLDSDDWCFVEMTPTWSGDLHAVDFWTTSAPVTYTIYVYDDFNGSSLSNLLAGPVTGTLQELGFYSIDLPSPPSVSLGDPVYITVRFQTAGYGYPIPEDDIGPMETNKSYVSSNGVSWLALDAGNLGYGDVAVRGRVKPFCAFSFPTMEIQVIGTERVKMGVNDGIRYYIEVVNRATVPDVLFEDAPDLYPYTPQNSRSRIEVLDAYDHQLLNTLSELDSSADLDSLYFDNWIALPPPDSIYIGLMDQRCMVSYGSKVAPLVPPTCGQANLPVSGYREVSLEDSLWAIQVEISNLGPGKAYEITATMHSDEPWLTIVDAECSYGDIDEGSTSDGGSDTYLLDMHGYPGGSFDLYLDLDYEDICYIPYSSGENLELNMETTGTETPQVTSFALIQNYPNPFNPHTSIRYEIPIACHVRLKIYDVSGRLIRTLVDRNEPSGRHMTPWNGRDDEGRSVASGIYFYRLQAGGFTDTKRMVLIR